MPLLNEKPDNSMHLPFPVERTVSEEDSKLRWIGFQMGASSFKKCWPVERFVTFANQLFAHDDVRVVLIGAPNEVPLQDEFLQKLDSHFHDRVKPLIGKTTLKGLIQEVKNMDLLVTSDTGPMHLAWQCGTDGEYVCDHLTLSLWPLSGPSIAQGGLQSLYDAG